MKYFKLTLIVLLINFAMPVAAQGSGNLTEEERNEITVRTAQKLEQFLQMLGYVVSNDPTVQDEGIKSTLALFIGKGGPYTMEDMYGASTHHDGVTMQTASLRSRNAKARYNRPILMTRYLNNLRGNTRYNKIEIKQVGTIRVDNIHQIGPNRYQAIAHFCQYFAGLRDNGTSYVDETGKSVKVYVEKIDDGGSGTFQILLGDMRVESITK